MPGLRRGIYGGDRTAASGPAGRCLAGGYGPLAIGGEFLSVPITWRARTPWAYHGDNPNHYGLAIEKLWGTDAMGIILPDAQVAQKYVDRLINSRWWSQRYPSILKVEVFEKMTGMFMIDPHLKRDATGETRYWLESPERVMRVVDYWYALARLILLDDPRLEQIVPGRAFETVFLPLVEQMIGAGPVSDLIAVALASKVDGQQGVIRERVVGIPGRLVFPPEALAMRAGRNIFCFKQGFHEAGYRLSVRYFETYDPRRGNPLREVVNMSFSYEDSMEAGEAWLSSDFPDLYRAEDYWEPVEKVATQYKTLWYKAGSECTLVIFPYAAPYQDDSDEPVYVEEWAQAVRPGGDRFVVTGVPGTSSARCWHVTSILSITIRRGMCLIGLA